MNTLQITDALVDDALAKAREFLKKWDDRLSLDNLRLSERYLKKEITIIMFWDVRGAEQPNDLCAVLQYGQAPVGICTDGSDDLKVKCDAGHVALHIDGGTRNTLDGTSYDNQEFVFVKNVELVEFPEFHTPGVVRLVKADDYFRSMLHSLYFSRKLGWVFGRSVVDREASLVARRASFGHQLPNQIIERASEGMDGIPGDQGQIKGNRLPLVNPMNLKPGKCNRSFSRILMSHRKWYTIR